MTDIQNRLFTLLCDLDDICKKEGIPYYLIRETAQAASLQQAFFPNCRQITVGMYPKQAIRFARAVKKQKRADRIVDAMCTNSNYPEFTMRYGDPTTLMFQAYDEKKRIPCMSITIEMICPLPKRLTILPKVFRRGWQVCCTPVKKFHGKAHRAVAAVCHGVKAVGGKLFSGLVFKLWAACFPHNGGAKKFTIGKSQQLYSAKLLKNPQMLTFEGRQFPGFSNVAEYLDQAYGQKLAPGNTSAGSQIMSVHIPYRLYLDTLYKKMDMEKVYQDKAEYDEIQGKVVPYNRKIARYYDIVARTERRFALYEQYMPMKEQLLALRREEKFEELNELLFPYRSEIYGFYKKKLGLCFDKEIFDITMELLERENRQDYVRKVRALVPEEHWKPLVITNYKGDVV